RIDESGLPVAAEAVPAGEGPAGSPDTAPQGRGAGWRPRPWLSASARRERDAMVVQLAGEAHQWRARDVGQLAFAVAGQRDHAHAVDVPVVAADATAEAGDQAEFGEVLQRHRARQGDAHGLVVVAKPAPAAVDVALLHRDRKSTLLNSSHVKR